MIKIRDNCIKLFNTNFNTLVTRTSEGLKFLYMLPSTSIEYTIKEGSSVRRGLERFAEDLKSGVYGVTIDDHTAKHIVADGMFGMAKLL